MKNNNSRLKNLMKKGNKCLFWVYLNFLIISFYIYNAFIIVKGVALKLFLQIDPK